MAISIVITNGAETVTLTATDARLESYVEQTPDIGDNSVTESLDVEFIGGNAAVDANIAKLERLFQGARDRAANSYGIDFTYIVVTLDSAVWQSLMLDGKVLVPGDSWHKYERATGTRKASVIVQREAWWESTTTTNVPLSNKYGTNVTTGLQVDNHDDSGHDNFVNIAAAAIVGDVPVPAILTATSATAGLDVMLSQVLNNAGGLVTILEGEAGTGAGSVTVTPTADAGGCSGGNYGACAWNGTVEGGPAWALGATNAEYFGGRVFRPVMRLRDLVAGGEKIWVQWIVSSSGGSLLAAADGLALPLDARMVVFPPMAIPPWPKPPAGFSWEDMTLYAAMRAEGAGAHALNLDFVSFMPCDSWLRFLPLVLELATSIRYECGSGLISRATTGMVSHVPDGPGLMLYPGVAQKIYFAGQKPPLADIAYNITLKLQYRARKRVL